MTQRTPTTEMQRPLASQSVGRATPRMHLRLRATVGLVIALTVAGLWSIASFTQLQYAIVAPGKLSSPHAQLWQGSNHLDSCKNCHPNVASSELEPDPNAVATQAMACAKCHAGQMPNLIDGTPHDLPISKLQSIGLDDEASSDATLVSTSRNRIHVDWQHRSFACSDCHREHQGRSFNLAAMDDMRCQACHQQRFDRFDGNHAEFDDYPEPSNISAIAFNHRSHATKHFAKQQTNFDCNVCHLENHSGVQTLVRTTGFEQACAKCHREPLSSSLSDGIVLWQLPSVDVAKLSESGDANSTDFSWPESVSATNDLMFQPLMRQMLIHELELRDDPLSRLAALRVATVENLSELESDAENAASTIIAIAEASRDMLHDIATNGQSAISKRLSSQKFSSEPRDHEIRLISAIVKGIPPNLFEVAVQRWFASTLSNSDVESNNLDEEANEGDSPSPFLPKLMPPRPVESDADSLTLTAYQSDELLDEGGDDQSLLDDGSTDLLTQDDETLVSADESTPNESTTATIEYDARLHLPSGGWMIDEVREAIVYVPSGHGDLWMQAYAEWLLQDAANHDSAKDSQSVVSRCLECHRSPLNRTSLPNSDLELSAAWQAPSVDPRVKKLTRFDHRPHLVLPDVRDCKQCHALNEDSINDATIQSEKLVSTNADRDSSVPEFAVSHGHSSHDFKSISKQFCVNCHNSQTQVQSCTVCHSYHVTDTNSTHAIK
jgi:hypothetical protein